MEVRLIELLETLILIVSVHSHHRRGIPIRAMIRRRKTTHAKRMISYGYIIH